MGEGQADRQRAGLWWEWREMRGTHLFPGGHPGRLPGESGLRRRSEVGACPLNLASFAFGRCYPFTAKLSKTALWGFLAYFFSLAFFFFFFFTDYSHATPGRLVPSRLPIGTFCFSSWTVAFQEAEGRLRCLGGHTLPPVLLPLGPGRAAHCPCPLGNTQSRFRKQT